MRIPAVATLLRFTVLSSNVQLALYRLVQGDYGIEAKENGRELYWKRFEQLDDANREWHSIVDEQPWKTTPRSPEGQPDRTSFDGVLQRSQNFGKPSGKGIVDSSTVTTYSR